MKIHLPGGFRPRALLGRLPLAYAICIALWSTLLLARWPVLLLDTDLWYHLEGGRTIVTGRSLPTHTYFSFLRPPRDFIDYYWLFQVVAYLTHSAWDYAGLIGLRTLAYAGLLAFILALLWSPGRAKPARFYMGVLSVFYVALFAHRFTLIRPHIFSYLFTAAFLCVVELRPARAFLLPAIALLWSNVHGVSFPTIWLLGGAYIAEYFWSRIRGSRPDPAFLMPVALSMFCVFLTPHGIRLFELPIESLEYVSLVIGELRRSELADLLSFEITRWAPSFRTLFNFVFVVTLLSAITSIAERRARLSHFLLLAGAGLLLSRGARFEMEFALLALPLLRTGPVLDLEAEEKALARPAYALVFAALMLLPLLLLRQYFSNRPRYPFSPRGLPQGVSAFLNRTGPGGSVLNDPDLGGYLRWMLYPRYKILMDNEVPFPFTNEDLHVGNTVFFDEKILRKILSEYAPSFIAVPVDLYTFKERIAKLPRYTAVFVDDANVLYADGKRHPALAKAYALRDLDPYQLVQQLRTGENPSGRWKEPLARMLEFDPESQVLRSALAVISLGEGAYERALPHAEALIHNYPENPAGYEIKGDALSGLGRFHHAAASYENALRHVRTGGRGIYAKLGRTYLEEREYPKGYRALRKGIDPYSPETSIEDSYRLARAALLVGEEEVARSVFKFLQRYRLSEKDRGWAEKIKREIDGLGR